MVVNALWNGRLTYTASFLFDCMALSTKRSKFIYCQYFSILFLFEHAISRVELYGMLLYEEKFDIVENI